MITLLEYFKISETYQLPDKIMGALFSDNAVKFLSEVSEFCNIENIRDLYQEEQGDRKTLKQDFTPDCICEIIAGITKDGDVLDMCAGTGALSSAIAKKKNITIHEQEYSERTLPFLLLDACLNGFEGIISRADCLRGKVFESYRLEKFPLKEKTISVPKKVDAVEAGAFDNVIMNPPYSAKFDDAADYPMRGFVVPKSKADFGFVLQGLEHLKEGGRLIAVLPHGVLFRGQKEAEIREFLIKEHLLSAVIGLPDKLFLNTQIPVCLLVLEKGAENILFIDASKTFVKQSKQNDMSAEHIKNVIDVFSQRRNVEKFAHAAEYDEIERNGYNLNIPRYVDTSEQEPEIPLSQLFADLFDVYKEKHELHAKICNQLNQLTAEDADNMRALCTLVGLINGSIDFSCSPRNVNEVADFERAKSGKIYPSGCTYINISCTNEDVGYTSEETEIESRCGVFIPKDGIDGKYLNAVINQAWGEFLRKARTTMNLQTDTIKGFEVMWHNDEIARRCIAAV